MVEIVVRIWEKTKGGRNDLYFECVEGAMLEVLKRGKVSDLVPLIPSLGNSEHFLPFLLKIWAEDKNKDLRTQSLLLLKDLNPDPNVK
jgi:hypothetical protein